MATTNTQYIWNIKLTTNKKNIKTIIISAETKSIEDARLQIYERILRILRFGEPGYYFDNILKREDNMLNDTKISHIDNLVNLDSRDSFENRKEYYKISSAFLDFITNTPPLSPPLKTEIMANPKIPKIPKISTIQFKSDLNINAKPFKFNF